jgi:predicted chitinase
LKTRLHDFPGIDTLTMTMLAGRQNYNLNGRVIALDASASDFEVEKAIDHEMAVTTFDIKAALWAGNVELAKVLISKRMGLRICAGERQVRLKRAASDLLATS